MNFGFIIDNRKCIGCHACTVACKSEHDVPVGVNRTWVKYIEKGEFPDTRRLFSVMRCNHCADAPCVDICPTEALHTRKDGIVDFDDRRCISCKACTQACPYDALYIHPETKTAAKCNYCTHRVEIGLEPACVVVCPEHAIISGDMDNPQSEISKLLSRETVSVRKAEKGTNPKLFYIDGDNASLEPGEAHPDTEYMWSSQSSGVGKYAKYAEMRQTNGNGNGLVQIEGRKKPKRVYDAPSKGMLWGWEVSAYVLTKAIAAGAFIVPVVGSILFYQIPELFKQIGAIVAFVFLGLTGLLLIKDLGRPDRFLYVLLRPQWKSWLSRGAYIITIYGAALSAWLAASYFEFYSWLPAIEAIGLVFAFLSAVYTAFLFAQAKGRDLWQSPMLGVHMILHSIMAGLAVFLVANFFLVMNIGITAVLTFVAISAIVLHLVTLAIEMVTPHGTEDAHKTVKMIVSGKYSREFWLGMVMFGNVLPAALLYYSSDFFILGASGLLILVGLYVAQVIWVRAPQEIALS